eukprot:g55985.t1
MYSGTEIRYGRKYCDSLVCGGEKLGNEAKPKRTRAVLRVIILSETVNKKIFYRIGFLYLNTWVLVKQSKMHNYDMSQLPNPLPFMLAPDLWRHVCEFVGNPLWLCSTWARVCKKAQLSSTMPWPRPFDLDLGKIKGN